MVVMGYDGSSFQGNFDHAHAYSEDFRFAFWKVSQGRDYRNPTWAWNRDAAKAAGILMCPYIFVEDDDAAAQVDTFVGWVGTKPGIVAIDHEQGAGNETRNAQVFAEFRRRGWTPICNYLPQWYWQQIGSPAIRNGPMWASHYTTTPGTYASQIAQGVTANYWQGYGGQPVALVQFTDHALIAGQRVDSSIYPGTLAQLRQFFRAAPPAKPVAAASPPVTVPSLGVIQELIMTAPDLSKTSVAGLKDNGNYQKGTTRNFTMEELAQGWANTMVGEAGKHFDGALTALVRAVGAEVAKIDAKVDALAKQVAGVATPDVKALAAAIAPALNRGASADEIAHAVLADIGTALGGKQA